MVGRGVAQRGGSNKRRAGVAALALAVGALLGGRGAGAAPASSASPQPSAAAASHDSAAVARALDKLAADVKRAGGEFGVQVVEVDTGKVWASHTAAVARNPASNMKVVTVWAALRRLGPQHTYRTSVHGRIRGGRAAQLVVRGGGDPSLSMRHLWEMVARLERAGLREVGDILVDQSRFDGTFTPPAFDQQPNEWAAFRAPVAPLSLDHNAVTFEIRAASEGQRARVAVEPPGFVSLTGRVDTSAKGEPEDVKLSIGAAGHTLSAKVGGSVPEGSRTVRVRKRVDDPTLLAGSAVKAALVKLGVKVDGEVRQGGESSRLPLLSAHRSAPLAVLVRGLGKFSNNFYAEMIFKSLALSRAEPPATFEGGAEVVREELKDAGIDPSGLTILNGSGLFTANELSPQSIAAVLRDGLRDSRVGPELVSQLAIGGVDGTLRHRFRRHAKTRAVRAKTGTLNAVSALSGVILAPPGRSPLAFSVLVEKAPGKAVKLRRAIDAFVDAVARERWKR